MERQTADFFYVLFRPKTIQLVFNTLSLILAVLILCTVLAVPIAYLIGRRDFRGSRWVTALLPLPLSIPGYVIAWSLLSMSGESGIIKDLFGFSLPSLRGLVGAALAMSFYCFPILAINMYQGFRELDPRLEEAAKTLGKSRGERFWQITLPQLWPSMLSGWILIAIYVLSDFGVPALMGFEVLASAIYTEIITSYFQDGAFALTLLSMTMTLILLVAFHTGPHRPQRRLARAADLARPYSIGNNTAWFIVFFSLAPVFATPLVSLGYWLGQPSTWETFGTYNYLVPALFGTLQFALPGTILGSLLALAVGLISRYLKGWIHELPGRVLLLLYSLPGTALALCWAVFYLQLFRPLYQSATGYVIALGYLSASLSLGPVRTALHAQSETWTDSARTLGKSPREIFVRIVWPGIKPGVVSGFLLSLGWIIRELPLAVLLTPLGARTLSLAVFGYTVEANYAGAAPYVFMQMALGLSLGLLSSLRRTRDAA